MMLGLRITVIALIQCLFLGSMVYDRIQILEHGKTIVLKTTPIDPRSLFRGDYVTLRYDISQLDAHKLEGENSFDLWQKIFVAVEKRGEIWEATGLYSSWPQIIGDQIILAGRVKYDAGNSVWIKYGIDSYFVPEGKGKEIEKAIGDRMDPSRVLVQIAVSDTGKAAIKGLSLDGKLLTHETWF